MANYSSGTVPTHNHGSMPGRSDVRWRLPLIWWPPRCRQERWLQQWLLYTARRLGISGAGDGVGSSGRGPHRSISNGDRLLGWGGV